MSNIKLEIKDTVSKKISNFSNMQLDLSSSLKDKELPDIQSKVLSKESGVRVKHGKNLYKLQLSRIRRLIR